jgi:hypothetical protein
MKIKIRKHPGPASDHVHYDDVLDKFVVEVSDNKGRCYTHYYRFKSIHQAIKLAERVVEAGQIDPDHWDVYVPYGTEAWLDDGFEQRTIEDERDGFL